MDPLSVGETMQTNDLRSSEEMKFRGRLLGTLAWILFLGVGAVVLYPVFASPKPPSHVRPTMSKVKQLVTSMSIYQADYDDHLPMSRRWMDDIYMYLKNEDIYRDLKVADRQKGDYGFAFYEPLSGIDASAVYDPASVPLVFQSSLLHRSAAGDLSTLPVPARSEIGNIVGFLDNHVVPRRPPWPETPTVIVIRPKPEDAK